MELNKTIFTQKMGNQSDDAFAKAHDDKITAFIETLNVHPVKMKHVVKGNGIGTKFVTFITYKTLR